MNEQLDANIIIDNLLDNTKELTKQIAFNKAAIHNKDLYIKQLEEENKQLRREIETQRPVEVMNEYEIVNEQGEF